MAYELALIINPILEKSDAEATAQKIAVFINNAGGSVKTSQVGEKKKLAYAIKKQLFGYFSVMQFDMESDKVDDLQKQLNLDTDVLRSLIINLDELRTQKPTSKTRRPSATAPSAASAEATPAAKPEKAEKVKIEELDKKLEELLKE